MEHDLLLEVILLVERRDMKNAWRCWPDPEHENASVAGSIREHSRPSR
jgi:hypothetical protein